MSASAVNPAVGKTTTPAPVLIYKNDCLRTYRNLEEIHCNMSPSHTNTDSYTLKDIRVHIDISSPEPGPTSSIVKIFISIEQHTPSAFPAISCVSVSMSMSDNCSQEAPH